MTSSPLKSRKPANTLVGPSNYDVWHMEVKNFLALQNLWEPCIGNPRAADQLDAHVTADDASTPTFAHLEQLCTSFIIRSVKSERLIQKIVPLQRPSEAWEALKPPQTLHDIQGLLSKLRSTQFDNFKTMDAYLKEMYTLRNRITRNAPGRQMLPEPDFLRAIIYGLPKQTFRELQLAYFSNPNNYTLNTVENALYEIVSFEKELSRHKPSSHPSSKSGAYAANGRPSDKNKSRLPPTPCKHCGEMHWNRDCPTLQQDGSQSSNS